MLTGVMCPQDILPVTDSDTDTDTVGDFKNIPFNAAVLPQYQRTRRVEHETCKTCSGAAVALSRSECSEFNGRERWSVTARGH